MPSPTVIAHRGFGGVAPENTVAAAVRAADADETAMVEIDVQPAADGTPVVFHDDRLDGLRDGEPITDASGLVWETSIDEVRAAEVLDSGERVPTLKTLLDALPATVGVNVELKNPGRSDLRVGEALPEREREERREVWQEFVERVVADCDAFPGDVLFSSFCEGALAAAREVAPEYAVAPLLWGSVEDGLEIARRYDCEAVHPPWSAIVDVPMATESYAGFSADEPRVDVVQAAHAEGRAVNVWSVGTWRRAARLATAGVDGIIADYPGLLSFVR